MMKTKGSRGTVPEKRRLAKRMARRSARNRPKRATMTAAMKEEAEKDRRFVYTVLTDNGPDVSMWSAAFGRLVGRARRANVTSSYDKCYAWLLTQGYFGPKSDSLRSDADKYW